MKRLTASLLALTGLFILTQGSTAAAAAPSIPLTTVSHVTTQLVELEADINPQGTPLKYHFEYGPEDCISSPCTSTAEAQLAGTTSPLRVKAHLEGLPVGTRFHFRVVAKNIANETTPGPDRIFATYLPPQVFSTCSNEAFRANNPAALRIEYSSANLPDCRAYEQASPIDKNGGDVTGTVPFERASVDGGAISFLSVSGLPGGVGSQEVPTSLARRGTEAWSNQGLNPPATFGQQGKVIGWTPDFSDVYSQATQLGEPELTSFLLSSGGASPTVIATATKLEPRLAATSEGGAQVLFESNVALPSVPGAVAGNSNLYIWDKATGKLSLAGIMNDKQAPPKGAFAGPYDWVEGTTPLALAAGGARSRYYTQEEHTLAADGSAAYFTAAGSGKLYVRLNPTEEQSKLDSEGNCSQPELACTLQVNASHKKDGTGPDGTDPAGAAPAAFMGASKDGTRVLFTSSEKLTDDANTGPEQEPAAISQSDLEGKNVDHTFLPTHAGDVEVDGEYIYWVNIEKDTIGRAKLGATGPEGVEDEFITATEDTKGIAVANGFIYWTNGGCEPEKCTEGQGEGTIGRAELDTSGAKEVKQDFIPNAGNAWAIAVNASHIYWTNSALENSGQQFIARASTEGTEANREFIETANLGKKLPGIALDAGHVYWTWEDASGFSSISRAKLDGTGYVNVFLVVGTSEDELREKRTRGITVSGDHLYWAAQGSSEIGRAKLNGDGAADDIKLKFIEDAGHPNGVAVDGANIYWSANGEASPNPGNDLYRYDSGAPPEEALVDLVADSTDTNGAEVRGVLGASADASHVYFAANGVPDGVSNSPNGRGEEAQPGDCPALLMSSNQGECNLYLSHDDTIEFIARLEVGGGESDAQNWAAPSAFISAISQRMARVSPDGQTLLFSSRRQLSDYANEGKPQLYRFEAGKDAVSCVTCDPSGEAPRGGEKFFGRIVPPATVMPPAAAPTLSHNLSLDGERVFFETTDSLVIGDTNGENGCPPAVANLPACTDVYEWEAVGAGSCDAAHAVAEGGCLYLISTGKGPEPALIADASEDGGDVFFFSRSRLVGQDEDSLVDVYDARVGGGLVGQNQPPPAHCSGESCKPSPPPPPAIANPPKVEGKNFKPKKTCPKHKHRVKGRCVAKRKAKRHHKQKGHHKGGKAKAKGRQGR